MGTTSEARDKKYSSGDYVIRASFLIAAFALPLSFVAYMWGAYVVAKIFFSIAVLIVSGMFVGFTLKMSE